MHEQPQNAGRRRAECLADADLANSSLTDVRRQSEDACEREPSTENAAPMTTTNRNEAVVSRTQLAIRDGPSIG